MENSEFIQFGWRCLMKPGLHLEPFLTMIKPGAWNSPGVRQWVYDITKEDERNLADHLPKDGFSRSDLKALARSDSGCPTAAVMWAILGWGKMHRRHARAFFNSQVRAERICDEIRKGRVDRLGAFDLFARALPEMRGITAAYFTKLIFFLGQDHDGYIMDQWTSKSINLIFEKEVVMLGYSGHVSRQNTKENYAEFCRCIEWLTHAAPQNSPFQPIDGEGIEMALFSKGGRKPDKWREYVRRQWARHKVTDNIDLAD